MARQLTLEIAVEKTRAQQELRDLEQGMKNLEQAALKTGAATDKQTAAYDNLSKRAADTKTKIKSLGDETKSTTDAQDKATKATGMMSSAILKYVSAGAVIAAVKWTADWADRLEELSKQTGLSITMVQKLDQITKQNGATIETLARAFGTLQDRLAGGDKSAVRAFDKLGLSVDTFLRMRPDDQIENFAIAVAKIEDPMQRANAVTDALGKGGIALIPTLLEIAKGMDGISTAAEANVRAMGKLSDWWETLKGTGARLIVDALGPMVTAWEKLTLGTDGFLGRLQGLHAFVIQAIPAFRLLHDVMPLPDIGHNALPKPPDAPGTGLEGPGGGNGLGFDPFDPDAVAQMAKDAAALVNAQIATQRATAALAKEAAQAVKEAAEAADRSFTHMRDMAAGTVEYAARWVQMGAINSAGPNGWGIPKGGFQSSIYWTNQLPGNIGQGYAPNAMPAITGMNDPFGYGAYRQPPSRLAQYRMQFNNMQSDWRYQNFGTAEGWMQNAQGWGSELQDISEHGDPLVNATNVRGRGKRAAMGALKGAELGGKFGGPYGAAGGAVVGLLVGAFRNPAFEDVWNRIAKNFGVTVSDELAKGIATTAKELFNNNRQAAEVFSLDKIIGEGGGINDKNVDALTARFRDAFSLKGQDIFSQDQLTEVVEKNFGAFAEHVKGSGKIASDQFLELIKLAKEFGVESKAIKDFVGGEASTVGDGLSKMLAPLYEPAIRMGGALDAVKAEADGLWDLYQREQAAGASKERLSEINDKYVDAVQREIDLQAQQKVEAQAVAGDLENIGVVALAAFNKASEAGLSFGEAIDAISPALDDLLMIQKAYGLESENSAVKQLIHYRELAEAHRPLIDAAAALNETMLALSNIGGLNKETLAAMEDQGMRTFNRLIDAGFTENESLTQMGDWLGTIRDAHEQLGIPIDENTQALLDQATAQGILKDKALETNNILMDGLGAIIQAVGGDLPDAWKHAADAARDESTRAARDAQAAFNDVHPTIPVTYEFPDDGPRGPNGNPNGYASGGVVRPRYAASGMFVPRGTDTVPAMLTPGEGVLSRRGMRTLAKLNDGVAGVGGSVFNISIHADSAEGGKAAARAFTDELKRRGIQQRSVA